MKKLLNTILISLVLFSCQPDSLDYTILEKIDISLTEDPGMKYNIILNVNTLPTDEEMKKTALEIWRDGNKNWNEFLVLMYLPDMNIEWAPYISYEFDQKGLAKTQKRIGMLTDTRWDKNPSKSKEYFIDVSTSRVNGRNVNINVNTNFPENTNLLISVERNYYMEGVDEVYSGDIFSEDLTVSNGKINAVVNITDKEWYSEAQKLSNISPNDVWTTISNISDTIDIHVSFSPRRKQLDDILQIVGNDGEFIKGNGVDKRLGFTTQIISKKMEIPFKK